MAPTDKISIAINGYGVIGKRVADAVAYQEDMTVAGVCDVATDWPPAWPCEEATSCSERRLPTWTPWRGRA